MYAVVAMGSIHSVVVVIDHDLCAIEHHMRKQIHVFDSTKSHVNLGNALQSFRFMQIVENMAG